MRNMISILFLLILILATGCSADHNVDLSWFDNSEAAIQDGIQQEEITASDILEKVDKDGETLIIYKMKLPDGIGIGVSSLVKNNGKFAWYRPDQPVLVQNTSQEHSPVIKTAIQTATKKSYTIYLGSTTDQNLTIRTDKGTVSPTINKDSGLFYYIE